MCRLLCSDDVPEEERASLEGIAELIVRKNRNGPIDTVKLAFLDKYASFSNLARSDFAVPAVGDDEAPPIVDAIDA